MTDEAAERSPKDQAKLDRANLKAEKARLKVMRPWYKKKRYILGIGLVVVIGAAVAGAGSDDSDTVAGGDTDVRTSSGNTENPPTGDVEIASCGVDDVLGFLEASVRVTNHSSKASNYLITVAFESPDGSEQYETSLASVNGLEPGQSRTADAVTLTEAPTSDFECRVTEVDRFAA